MTDQTRFADAVAEDPLFAELLDEAKDGKKAPGYNPNDLVDPVPLSAAQQKRLEDWGL